MPLAKVSLFFSLVVWGAMMGPSSALDHIVGGSLGWDIPPTKTHYEDWAKPRIFGVQDKLVFPFRDPMHNVIEVNKEEFENCTQENALNMWAHGPLILNFTQPGEHFYYSSIGTQCELGVKLHINVVPGKGSTGRVFASTPAPTQSATSSASPVAATSGVVFVVTGLASLAWGLFL